MRAHCRSFVHTVSRRLLAMVVLVLSAIVLRLEPALATLSVDEFLLPAGDNPQSLAAADCDGNGALDLLAANFGSDTVAIYPNEGFGVFGAVKTIATPPKPAGAACGDLNGDGLFDVVVASFANGTVTVYLGAEAGGFTESGTFAVGAGPRTVALTDFDGLGFLDIVVVNSRSDNVSVLLGDGTGDFPHGATINVSGLRQSNPPIGGFVAYYEGLPPGQGQDEDPLPDLAIVSQGRPSLHVLVNGAGLSTEPMPELPRSRGVGGADVNDDGLPDLAVLSTESVVRILLGTDTGSFVVDETILVHPSARAVALGDFDQDGLVDLAVAYNDDNTVQIIPATGRGRFPTVAPAASESHNPLGVLAGRSTDGSDQLVLVDRETRDVSLLEADATGAIVPTFLQSTANAPRALVLADMNGDNILDAVTVVKVGREVAFEILPGTADNAFDTALAGPGICGDGELQGAELCDDGNRKRRDGCSKTCNPEIGRDVLSLDAADIDGDGDTDLVVVDLRRQILLLLGDGAARFEKVSVIGKARAKTTAQVGDFDGNGTIDIAYLPARSKNGSVAVLFNDGAGNFEGVAVVPKGRFRGPLLSGDVDGNGTLDLVAVTRAKPKGIVSLLNDGVGPERSSPVRKLPRGLRSLAAADFNEDGRLDLLAEFRKRRQLPLMMRGIGGGEFSAGTSPSGERFVDAKIFDVDHDLHEDIVICDGDAPVPCHALYGNGAGQFDAISSSPEDMIGGNLVHFVEADVDLDGVIDTVGASRNDNRVVVLFASAGSPDVQRVELGPSSKPNVVAVGDVNGDGIPDVVVSNEGTHDISRFMQGKVPGFGPARGDRSFIESGIRTGTEGVRPLDMALADLDGQPPLDVVVSLDILDAQDQSGPSGVVLFRTQGALLAKIGTHATGSKPQALAVGLLNDDGRPDIVTADYNDDTLTLLLTTGADAYDTVTLDSGGNRPTDILLADVNGDAQLDLVTVNEQTGNIAVLAGDGLGNFALPVSTLPLGRERPWNLCVGDFDGDEDVDLAVASVKTADIAILTGLGDGTWRDDGRVFSIDKDPRPLVCRDVNGDGVTDVRFARRASGRVDTILSEP